MQISEFLVFLNMAAAFSTGLLSISSAMPSYNISREKQTIYLITGFISIYFFVCYLTSLIGIMEDDVLGPCYLNPALLALFFLLMWHIIVDRNLWWQQKL